MDGTRNWAGARGSSSWDLSSSGSSPLARARRRPSPRLSRNLIRTENLWRYRDPEVRTVLWSTSGRERRRRRNEECIKYSTGSHVCRLLYEFQWTSQRYAEEVESDCSSEYWYSPGPSCAAFRCPRTYVACRALHIWPYAIRESKELEPVIFAAATPSSPGRRWHYFNLASN